MSEKQIELLLQTESDANVINDAIEQWLTEMRQVDIITGNEVQ